MKRIVYTAVVALGAASVLGGARPGRAATLRATPSIALEGTWDSNIFNAPSGEESDLVARATPGLSLSLEAERSALTLSGSVTAESYDDHHELNTWDATKRVDFSAPRLGVSSLLSLRAGARYLETNDIAQRSALILEVIPGLPPTETFVLGRTAARDYGGSVGASYRATPNVSLGIGGGASRLEYIDNRPGLSGSRTTTGDASGSYRVTPRATCGVYGSTGYSTYDGGASSRSYGAGASASYATSERTSLEARAGVSFLSESTAAGVVDHEQSPSGRLTFSYKADDFNAAVSGSYDLTGGGSFGEGTERANGTLLLGGRLNPQWSWDLSGGYQNERSARPGGTLDVSTASGTAGIRYAPARWISLRLAGYTFRQWNGDAAGADITRHRAVLGVTLSDTYPVF